MPTYNYYCKQCDSHFSYFQKMSESSFSICEGCGGKIERIISGGTGLIFKGSGFYLTDYKDKKKKTDEDLIKNKNSTDKTEKKDHSINTKEKNQTTPKKAEKKDE